MPVLNENAIQHGLNSKQGTKTFHVHHDDSSKAVTKKTTGRTALGVRRSALGDVTNKVTVPQGGKHALKKSSKGLTITTKIVKKDVDTPVAHTRMPLEEIRKPSPMCISNDLQSMTLSHSAASGHDIDSSDAQDELSAWQYAEDMHRYYMTVEKTHKASPNYMAEQRDINTKMRAILIDWLVDVHAKFDMHSQTLHIAINLIDRYLELNKTLARQRLQLVGITAMFIASKYEEIYPPDSYDFVRITDNAYTIEEVFEMEEIILKALGYRVTFPTAFQFVQRFLKASGSINRTVECLSHFVIDRSLQEYKMLKYPTSMVAASAVYIARIQGQEFPVWNGSLEYHSTYSESDLAACVQALKEILWSAQNGIGKSSKLSAVKRKFGKERFLSVSHQVLMFD